MKDSTKRLIAYGLALALGGGLLIYGVEADSEIVQKIASALMGTAGGALFLKRPREQ